MPTYEYICNDCDAVFAYRLPITDSDDDPIKVCPECDSANIQRKIGAMTVLFKSRGFYSTDSKRKK